MPSHPVADVGKSFTSAWTETTPSSDLLVFQRIYAYDPLRDACGRVFRPRAYGRLEADLTWSGWLVYFYGENNSAITTLPGTTESSVDALIAWAVGVSRVDLGRALARALQHESAPLPATDLHALQRLERAASAAVEIATQGGPDSAADARDKRARRSPTGEKAGTRRRRKP